MRFILIFLIAFPILSFSQAFRLLEPNTQKLNEELRKLNYSEDVIYLYLIHNYDSISRKLNVFRYDFPDYSVCAFDQEFANGIHYSIEQCKEAGGVAVSLVLPKADRKSVIKWVELIFESAPIDIEHGWNEDMTKFQPLDNGVGCYFEIKETANKTIIENYCGC